MRNLVKKLRGSWLWHRFEDETDSVSNSSASLKHLRSSAVNFLSKRRAIFFYSRSTDSIAAHLYLRG